MFKKYFYDFLTILCVLSVLFIASLIGGWCYNKYKLWAAGMEGEQELAKATASRKILIQEALAKKGAAHELAEAEIIRARGVSEANKIIGESLKGNDTYLKYLWITNIDHSASNQIIYIPTEANLPILEAGRIK